jgi:hypothetical protein
MRVVFNGKAKSVSSTRTSDLNLPTIITALLNSMVVVPVGLVNARLNQINGDQEGSGDDDDLLVKKQKTEYLDNDALSEETTRGGLDQAQWKSCVSIAGA